MARSLAAGNQYMLIHRQQIALHGLGKRGRLTDKGHGKSLLGISSKKNVFGSTNATLPEKVTSDILSV